MATLDEIAHAIVTVLSTSSAPEPMPVELKGHNSEQAAYFVRAVIDECTAAEVPLATVHIDSAWGLEGPKVGSAYENVPVIPDDDLYGYILFFRRFPTDDES